MTEKAPKIGVVGKTLAVLGSKEKKKQWRKVENFKQREIESKEHQAPPKVLAERFDEFYYKLNHLVFQTQEETKLAKLLYTQMREHETEDESVRAEEARQLILSGLIPRNRSEMINESGVGRHLRAYLMWRWAKKESGDVEGQPKETKSLDDFKRSLRKWVKAPKTVPPNLPESNLVVALAKRVGEDHTKWEVTPLQPD